MLAKIAEELEQVTRLFAYRNRAAGLFDQGNRGPGRSGPPQGRAGTAAGAGRQRGGTRRAHGPDGRGVLRSHEHSTGEPVLEGSVSAIALPIVYADQLHGVLYVETDKTSDFPQEEILFLGTLADLISGALHNALTFQKAQEQAITDGLTGLKTHRFFMEALSGGMEALDARGAVLLAGADGPGPLQIRQRFLWPPGRRPGAAARGAHSGAELPPLGRRGALWRRRIRHPDAGNRRRAKPPACRETALLDLRRSRAAREKRHLQLRRRHLSAEWIDAAGTDSSRRRLDVSLQASGRQRGFHRGSVQSGRFQAMEARRPRRLSRRHAQAPVRHRPRCVCGNLQPRSSSSPGRSPKRNPSANRTRGNEMSGSSGRVVLRAVACPSSWIR